MSFSWSVPLKLAVTNSSADARNLDKVLVTDLTSQVILRRRIHIVPGLRHADFFKVLVGFCVAKAVLIEGRRHLMDPG